VSSRLVDAFTTPWTADPSGRFTVRSDPSAARFGADRRGLEVVATPGATGDPPPFAEQAYAPALDLRDDAELRLWVRSTRAGDDGPARPAYLALEADTVPAAAAPWRRLVRIGAANRWELARLGLDDMPAPIRRAVGVLRLRSLDPEIAHRLFIEVATDKNHLHNILDKPNVTRRGQAAARMRALQRHV
jgi:hypothetical protein